MKYSNRTLFGLDFQVSEIKVESFPLFLTSGRSFFRFSYQGFAFILVRLSGEENFGVVALGKQAEQLSARLGMPVAFGFGSMTRTQRDSLVKQGIPFIAESGQIYLPFLGIALSDSFRQKKASRVGRMMPVTQALFLYMLYGKKVSPVMKQTAANELGVTKTSISRASEQLLAMDLIRQEKRGKEYWMSTNGSGIDLYLKAKPFLINPIQSARTTLMRDNYDEYPLSGESALSRMTMLAEPDIQTRAVFKSAIAGNSIPEIDIRWQPEVKAVRLEFWKYNPVLFSKNGAADPVSLSMCFEGNGDERIEEALEEYLEDYRW